MMQTPDNRRRGATLLSYGLMVGLVAVVALSAITTSGSSVNALMSDVANNLDAGTLGQGGSTGQTVQATPTPTPTPGISISGALTEGDPGTWSDGSYAVACWDYLIGPSSGDTPAQVGDDGTYTIDPDGSGGVAAFDVYCDMTTDGGGWTLVDLVAVDGEAISSRVDDSAATSLSITGGHQLPDYSWSSSAQILCMADAFTGTLPWRTFDVPSSSGLRNWPTTDFVANPGTPDTVDYAISNGNTDQGTAIWVYNSSGRTGTLWIGQGSNASCACGYHNTSAQSGLGTFSGSNNSCSTYAR